jgi:hypothetical protein
VWELQHCIASLGYKEARSCDTLASYGRRIVGERYRKMVEGTCIALGDLLGGCQVIDPRLSWSRGRGRPRATHGSRALYLDQESQGCQISLVLYRFFGLFFPLGMVSWWCDTRCLSSMPYSKVLRRWQERMRRDQFNFFLDSLY